MTQTKSITILILLFVSVVLLFCLIIYLNLTHTLTPQQQYTKNNFVSLTKLPDLAVGTKHLYIRTRSLDTISDIYSIYGLLGNYDKLSFLLQKSNNEK